MKKNKPFGELFYRSLKKTLLTMRIAIILMILGILQARANDAYSQKTMLSLNFSETELVKILDKIENESEFFFLYNEKLLDTERKVNITEKDQLIGVILDDLFKGTDVKYTIIDRKIILAPDYLPEVSQQQQFKVSGTITDSKGETLPGVNVILKGTLKGTTTDIEGRYTIDVPDGNGILVFSFIGYTNQEIAINGSSTIDVKLQEVSTVLGEVVVTALGIKRSTKSLTYSTQGVNTEQITTARTPNIMASLEGKVAGLSITNSGSGIGSAVRVVLRGNRSINGDSQPLYVIDGVLSGSAGDLSPDNIASINVLKGANASALYGSSAQNGVIIIETKKGVPGSHVSLNETFMVEDPYKLLPFQNVYGQGYGGVYSSTADASWGPKMEGQMVNTWSIDPADAGKKYAFLPQPNNRMDVFQKGYNMATNLIASMGSENIQTLLSYTYTDGKGIVPNNDLKKHNISLRIDNKLSSKLSLDSKIEYMQQQINNKGESYPTAIEQIYNMPANIRTEDLSHYEFTDINGNKLQNYWNPSTVNGQNAYWVLNRVQKINSNTSTIIMTSLNYSFSDALKLMVRGSYNGYNNTESVKNYSGTFPGGFGSYSESQGQGMSLNSDFLLSYTRNINKNWNVKVNVGGSTLKYRNSSLGNSTGLALLVPNLFSISNTSMPTADFDPGASSNKNSLYAFSNISWKNAVFFDITGRNDWSSTLPEKSRSYFYPSFGMSTVLNDLFPAFPKVISFAKLRISYATVGNDTKPYMLQRTAIFGPGGNNGFLQLNSLLPNSNLLSEKTSSSEIGLDIRFFDGRLGMDVTAYKTDTRNQLFRLSLPVGSGASDYFTNGGNIENKGLEAVLSLEPVKKTDFNWDITFNFAANRNKVVKISDASPRIIIPANDSYFKDFVVEQGAPYGQIYGKGWERDNQGRVIIGSDGLPLITSGRTVLLANFNPKWTGAILNSFSYKNFSLSFVIDTRQGGTMVSSSNAIVDGLGLSERTLVGREGNLVFGKNLFGKETAVLEDGTPNNISITAEHFWMYVGGRLAPIGEAFVVSATNIRFRELTIGYSLPNSLSNKLHLANMKISLVGRNLFFISRASLYADPDIMLGTDPTSEGFQYFNPPSSRYYGLNLNIGLW